MDWDLYTVFSVISGLMLIGMALYPGTTGGEKAGAFSGGCMLAGYGFYVASQSAGTFYFGSMIFALPFLIVFAIGQKIYRARQDEAESGTDLARRGKLSEKMGPMAQNFHRRMDGKDEKFL